MVNVSKEIKQAELRSIQELTIPGVQEIHEKLATSTNGTRRAVDVDVLARGLVKNEWSEEVFELVSSLPKAPVPKAADEVNTENEQFRVEQVVAQLKKLSKTKGALEQFALDYAEAVYLSGGAKPKGVSDSTYLVLQEVGQELADLRTWRSESCAPRSTDSLLRLRALDRQLIDYARLSVDIKAADYVALNAQHIEMVKAIDSEAAKILSKVPESFRSLLDDWALDTTENMYGWGSYKVDHIAQLKSAGILEEATVDERGGLIAYGRGAIDSRHYEASIPPRTRESMSEQIWTEFKTKYSNRYEPLGTSETRENGVPSLRDTYRLEAIAARAGVTKSHVELHLKYLEKHGLIKVDDGGYKLAAKGEHVGIGMRAIRFIQRAEEKNESPSGQVSIERYMDAARRVRESWKMPTYEVESADGGAPWVHLIDELYAGNARIDEKVLGQVLKDIRDSEDAIVIASNMLQGKPEVEPKAMRTSIPPEATDGIDYRDYGNQVALVSELLKSLGHPVLQVHGKTELETAEHKADVQRERDMRALRGMEKPDEEIIQTALSHVNAITERAGRKYNAKVQAQLLDLVSNVVMPLEMKLGRELMSSQQVREKVGLNMNELEIVRDVIGFLIDDVQSGQSEGKGKAQDLYGDFLGLPETGPEYLHKLHEVLFPEDERLEAGNLVARGGAAIQFLTPEGQKGLKMVTLPDARFGISEAMNPTEKIIGIIKSRTLTGEAVPDIVCTGATGQAYVSMTAGGVLMVSADTLQKSDFDDLYSFTEAGDRHKRRRFVRGGESQGGAIAFRGGVHDGIKTDAYTVRLWNPKIQEVLDENARRGLPSQHVDIYCTSDWQTGSPTSKPSTWLRGLFWAIENEQKEILVNGDVFQGQNYGRAPAEMQMTGLVGIEDQQAFVHALINPVLDMIKRKKAADPSWELPKWKIITGNHETNSQSGRGLQGIWFLQTLSAQVESFYRGAFGINAAEECVLYPKKFVDRMGVDVDYSHVLMDHSEKTGFRVAAQHYVGAGGKGSSINPPIAAGMRWGRAMEQELRPVHGILFGHWHTQSVTQSDGVFYAIFGAAADKSGFEWHLGYPTTVPSSGRVRLYSDRPPELFFVTDPYLRLQEEKLGNSVPEYAKLVSEHGSIEEYVEYERKRHQARDQKAFSYKELDFAHHDFIDPHRRIRN